MIYFLRYIGFIICLFATIIFFFPIALLRPFNTKNSHLFFINFRKVCLKLLGIELHVVGYEKLIENRPSVMIANHQHTFDILVAGGIFTPFLTTLGKFELALLPVLGQFYVLGNNVLIKRKNKVEARKSMDKVETKLKDNNLSVLIFPEGHRNPLPQLTKFKAGAFRIAINTGFPIVPIAISQYRHLENFNKLRKAHIYLEVLDPIPTKGRTVEEIETLIDETRNQMLIAVEKLNKNYQ